VKVWVLCLVQEPFSVAPCQTLIARFAPNQSLYEITEECLPRILQVRSAVAGSVIVELAVMPPAWLTTFPLLERDRLVALLQESSAPLFGEMVPYAITLVYPAPEAAVRVGPSSCEQARSLLSTAPAPSQLSAVGPSLGSSSD
jgi:hypothetical protein